MSENWNWTAIPRTYLVGAGAARQPATEPAAPPTDALPWSTEMNDLYIGVVQEAWNDLIRPDGVTRRGRPTKSLAREALTWLEEGGTVRMPDIPAGVSLFEVWGWPLEGVIRAAHARYADRAALWAARVTRLNARSTRARNLSAMEPRPGTRVATVSPNGRARVHGRGPHTKPPGVRGQLLPLEACTAGFVVPAGPGDLWEVEPPSPVAVQQGAPSARRPL